MKSVVVVSAASILACSCVLVDGYDPESTHQLRIVAPRAASYSVRLSTDPSTGASVPSDGRITVNVPSLRWGQMRPLGIPLTRRTHQPDIEVLAEGRVVKRIHVSSVDKLRVDDDGFHLVEIK